ncbi:MAG: GNAT family N-acetyltransferase [Bacteroidales bacterium]|nr:GNAT family N-acetyltransferase [Candidatus Physcousia equi]
MKLRALEPEDVDLLLAIENDETLWQVGSTNAPFSRYALTNYILTNQNDIHLDLQLRLVVEEQGETIGFVDLSGFSPQHRRAEIGIALLPHHRHKGFGKRALTLLLDYTHRHLPISTLFAVVSDDNEDAIRLFESAGFTLTATLPCWLRTPQGTPKNAKLFIIHL